MGTTQFADGSKVVGSDGSGIGTVKEVREDHLVVSVGSLLKHDVYVPIDRISATDRDDEIAVDIPAGQVDAEGWRFPPNAGYEHEDPEYPEVPETAMIQAAGMSAGRLSAPEPQGAVRDDGMIDQGEVPNEDLPSQDRPNSINPDDRQPS